MLAVESMQARSLYAQFFVDLRLSESQIDTLTDLIAKHDMPAAEQFLGSAGFQTLEKYQETLPERYQLNRLVSLLIAVGHELTSEQSSQLLAIMREERGDQLQHWPNSDAFDARIKPRFEAVLSVEQREFAERYFAGRAERRHAPGPAHSPD